MAVRSGLWVVLLLATVVSAVGQGPNAEAEKLKAARRAKLLESIRADAEQLKLNENRAFVLAKLGAAAMSTDEEFARKNFAAAIVELAAAQQEAEAAKGPNSQYHDLLYSQNTRPQILNIIAAADAETALDALARTRPAAVARALAGEAGSGKISYNSVNPMYLVQQEASMEQRFVRMAAEQRPEKGLERLKASIAKKLSNETYQSLQMLFAKEPAAAAELANDVVDRLMRANFASGDQPNYDLLNLAVTMLGDHVRKREPGERAIAFDDGAMRSLAEKVVETYLKRREQIGYVPIDQLLPVMKRYTPGSVEAMETAARSGRHGGFRMGSDPEFDKLLETNPSPEAILKAANGLPAERRPQLIQAAANRLAQNGQYQEAKGLLSEAFEGDALDGAISSLDWSHAHALMQKGQYDAAEALMMEFGEANRYSSLVSLAQTVYSADPEANRSRAIGILSRVRAMMPERPETSNQMMALFSVITATANIDAAAAFAELEPVTEQINSVSEAMAVVSSFQGGLRKGEYQLSHGLSYGLYIDPNMVRTLAQKDPDRTAAFVNALTRREIRILLRLGMLGGGVF